MNTMRHRQRGAALLVMMLVVLVAITAILVNRLSNANVVAARAAQSSAALVEARDALLAFAATEPDRVPGAPVRLPCPDLDAGGGFAAGEAHTTACGSSGTNMLGRLPWRTLDLPALKDGASACIWYAVSGDYKSADANSASLLNPDSAGAFQLFDTDSGDIIAGLSPEDRPVALLFAPGDALPSQTRSTGDVTGCSTTYSASDFLDAASAIGIDNAVLSGTPDTVDTASVSTAFGGQHNDRVLVVTRAELAVLVNQRHDYTAELRQLGLAVTECVADYARRNSGGSDDRRLPWPAPLALSDYRSDGHYDDADAGVFGGRLPNRVDDSAGATGNSLTDVLMGCDPAVVPAWTATMQSRWQNWKDHFFLFVAESYGPGSPVPSACTACITVNGAGSYAAVVAFADSALSGQTRTMPPLDTDTRLDPGNYLEGTNALVFPYTAGPLDLESRPAASDFNDRLFCIAPDLAVTEC